MPNHDGKTPEQRRRILEGETDNLYREVPGLDRRWAIYSKPTRWARTLDPERRLLAIRDTAFVVASTILVYKFGSGQARRVTDVATHYRNSNPRGELVHN